MYWMRAALEALRRHRETQERQIRKLRQMHWESERLRAELSHLEHEIYSIRDSELPRRQKILLEAAIRVRCRKVESEMLRRQYEIVASGHVLAYW
jgi:hypothetical protein